MASRESKVAKKGKAVRKLELESQSEPEISAASTSGRRNMTLFFKALLIVMLVSKT